MASLGAYFPLSEHISLAVISAEDHRGLNLHPAEMDLVGSRWSPKRRAEFRLGRQAASLALARLGSNPRPVLRGPGGEPLWPEGIVGSIAHCESWAVALVARSSAASAIGVDLERRAASPNRDIADVICCPEELGWASQEGACGERLIMLFSAKEAVFKALYPQCGRFIDFKDVVLAWNPEHQHFEGRLLVTLSPDLKAGHEFLVECELIGRFVFTFLVHPAGPRSRSHPPRSFVQGLRFHLDRCFQEPG